MSKCGACGRFVSLADGFKCTSCGNLYDKTCLKLPKSAKAPSRWLCPACLHTLPRKDNTDTPVKKLDELGMGMSLVQRSPSDKNKNTPTSGHSVEGEPQNIEAKAFKPTSDGDASLVQAIYDMKQEMISMRGELTKLGSKVDGLIVSVERVNNRIDAVESRVAALEEYGPSAAPGGRDLELVETIERLKLELNDRDQDLLLNDIDIAGIPEVKGENVTHLVGLVADKLGVQLDERDIVSAERAGPPPRAPGEGEGDARPRAVAVRLARRALRDRLLRAARVRRGADTAGFELPGAPRRFYVNERLTRTNRQLFNRARQEMSRQNWKFVWTRDGRIYARRQPETKARRIRCEEDLAKVFGQPDVGQ